MKRSSGSAAAIGFPMVVSSTAFGANEKIRPDVIGLGGRGAKSHVTGMDNQDNVEVVAVCDPDRSRLSRSAGWIKDWYKRDVDKYTDMREIMKRKDIDVVSIANQVYWHGLSTIWACQGGHHWRSWTRAIKGRDKAGGHHAGNVLAVKDLIAAIEEDRQPLSNLEDARTNLEMIVAVFKAHRVRGSVAFPLKNRKDPLTMLD